METQTVITHALTPGTRAHYSGTQNWGPATVTVDKPWGGLVDPMYVVRLADGSTYVVSQSELTPDVPVCGVSLIKATDRPCPNGVRYQPSEFELDRRRHNPAVDRYERQGDDLANNCPDALRSFFADAAGTGLVCTLRNLPESEWSY